MLLATVFSSVHKHNNTVKTFPSAEILFPCIRYSVRKVHPVFAWKQIYEKKTNISERVVRVIFPMLEEERQNPRNIKIRKNTWHRALVFCSVFSLVMRMCHKNRVRWNPTAYTGTYIKLSPLKSLLLYLGLANVVLFSFSFSIVVLPYFPFRSLSHCLYPMPCECVYLHFWYRRCCLTMRVSNSIFSIVA